MAFDPEFVDTYEIGVKSSWMDGRVNTSVAVFFSDYTDVQIPGSFGFDSDRGRHQRYIHRCYV